MPTLNPWINFNGNAEEAFNFYKSVFGGEFSKLTRFKDIATPEYPVEDAEAEKIMNITLMIGDGQMLIGNDVPGFMGTVSESENRSKIYVDVESREEAERVTLGLSAGGQVEVATEDDAEEAYFSMFRDVYGIEWIVEFDPNK